MIIKLTQNHLLFVLLIITIPFINAKIRNRRAVIWSQARQWPNRTIPYFIDQSSFNIEEITLLNDAIDAWNMETCINFRKKLDGDKNWVKITGGTNCHSIVGMNEIGEQELNLASPDCRFYGTYLHEIGHVLGLYHEHTRPGRDEHIHVYKDNIQEGLEDFYDKIDESELKTYDLPYDIQSIMHYGPKSFSGSDGQSTINVKNNSISHLLDEVHDKDLSFLDVKIINLYYNCSNLCQQTVSCPPYGFIDQFCQCHIPETFESRRCRNKNDNEWCEEQKKIGQCEYNPKYMSVYCRKTCDKCFKHKAKFLKRKKICKNFEKDKICDNWAKRGECEKNAGFMNIQCKKSCGICVVETTTPVSLKICRNKLDDEHCDRLESIGNCVENKTFMESNCQKACGFCGLKTLSTKIWKINEFCSDKLSVETCQSWAKNNECGTNYMYRMCKKTCKFCKLRKPDSVNCKNIFKDEVCEKFSIVGKCQSDSEFMRKHCMKTCDVCSMNSDGKLSKNITCKNVYGDRKCETLKRKGQCEKYPYFMLAKCGKTCWNCTDVKNNSCKNLEAVHICKKLASEGKCKSDIINMSINCAKTCKLCSVEINNVGCRNLNPDKVCEVWSRNDNCSKNSAFMMVQCAKSCGRCNSSSYTECSDLYKKELCRLWEKVGRCYKNPNFMLHHCAKSCGSCDLKSKGISNFVCVNKFEEKFCEIWKTDGECKTNRKFMLENCGKTCGTCRRENETVFEQMICENIYSDFLCNKWKSKGLCRGNNRNVLNKCAKTCGKCRQPVKNTNYLLEKCENVYNNIHCDKWKQSGECQKNPEFMKLQCRKSCEYCDSKIKKSNCKNLLKDEQCDDFAKKFYCEENPIYMLQMCGKTCNNCTYYGKLVEMNSSCSNKIDEESCELWSGTGECLKNPKYMLKSCAKSCGNCLSMPKRFEICKNKVDDKSCENWSELGECEKNPKYMLPNCAKSCKICKTTQLNNDTYPIDLSTVSPITSISTPVFSKTIFPLVSCQNLYRDELCEEWKKNGDCKTNFKLMFSQCRRSCGRCKKTLECQNVYNDQSCESWAKKGKCSKNMKFMLMLCMKSCGKCSILNFKIDESKKRVSNRCKNKYGEMTCESWKEIGECEKNSIFMKDNCAKSCGYCNTKTENSTKIHKFKKKICKNIYNDKICNEWANNRKCKSSFVLIVCDKSCTNCSQRVSENKFSNCRNQAGNRNCTKWKSLGLCERLPYTMSLQCAFTCDKCNLNSSSLLLTSQKKTIKSQCKNIAGDLHCSYWARQDQCEKNPSYMRIHCRKACNACITGKIAEHSCFDKFSKIRCSTWARRGECNRNKIWMSENCAKSCRTCQNMKSLKSENDNRNIAAESE